MRDRASIFPSPEEQRRHYLALVFQNGYQDGITHSRKVREEAYLDDEEALTRYRIGFRVGTRERNRHETNL